MAERNLDFDQYVNRYGTRSVKFDFAEYFGKPEGIIPMWVADMDFKTSSYIVDALTEALSFGVYGYSEGLDGYWNALKGWMKRRHDWDVDKSWLVKTPGIVFAISQAVRAFTKEGDNVIIQTPVYYPFAATVKQNGRRVVRNSLVLKGDRYEIDFDDFEKKIKDNDVKLFILCSPHNPVGRVWSEEELRKLGEICIRNNVIVVSDEIHADFVFEGKHKVFASLGEEFLNNSVICTAPSKTFNLAGLQVSNIFIANKELRDLYKKELTSTGYDELGLPALVACEAAYSHGEEWLEGLLKYIRGNIEYMREYLENNVPKIKMVKQEGLYLVWLDFRDLGLSDDEINERIVKGANLWFDEGKMFGTEGAGFQRINVACPRSTLKTALENLKREFG
ncbi:MAG: pyridoxal phosphate-dependent aminotransferase [Lachnospiraceae bacterium]|nr:pyridoxal phosphate-dependent aminotransferase [Lachnospiraceae bacterium]